MAAIQIPRTAAQVGAAPAAAGVPAGGTSGQVLAKASGTSLDTHWVDAAGGGGGTTDAALLTSGTLADARLSSNVPLAGGKAGGQTLRGDTAAAGDLTLQSTAHATRGNVYLNGPAGSYVNAKGSVKIKEQPGEYAIEIINTDGTSTVRMAGGTVSATGTFITAAGYSVNAFGAFVGVEFGTHFTFNSDGLDSYGGPIRAHDGPITVRQNTAPASASLVAGEVAWWFDATDGAAKVMFKGKSANGTVVSGSLPLS